jgi:hypothetical protein
MKKVHEFFCNLIVELNVELANADSFDEEDLNLKLKEAWELRMLVSEYIDWNVSDHVTDEEFCEQCD